MAERCDRWLPDVNCPCVWSFVSLPDLLLLAQLSRAWNKSSTRYLEFTLRCLRLAPVKIQVKSLCEHDDDCTYDRAFIEDWPVPEDDWYENNVETQMVYPSHVYELQHIRHIAYDIPKPFHTHIMLEPENHAHFHVLISLTSSFQSNGIGKPENDNVLDCTHGLGLLPLARPSHYDSMSVLGGAEITFNEAEQDKVSHNVRWLIHRYTDEELELSSLDQPDAPELRNEFDVLITQVYLDEFHFTMMLPMEIRGFYLRFMLYNGCDELLMQLDEFLKPVGLSHKWLAFDTRLIHAHDFYLCYKKELIKLLEWLRAGCDMYHACWVREHITSDQTFRYKGDLTRFIESTMAAILDGAETNTALIDLSRRIDIWTREIEATRAREQRQRDVEAALAAKGLHLDHTSTLCWSYINQPSPMWLNAPLTLDRAVQITHDLHVLDKFTDYQELLCRGFRARRALIEEYFKDQRRRHPHYEDEDEDEFADWHHDLNLPSEDDVRRSAKLEALMACVRNNKPGAELASDILTRLQRGQM